MLPGIAEDAIAGGMVGAKAALSAPR